MSERLNLYQQALSQSFKYIYFLDQGDNKKYVDNENLKANLAQAARSSNFKFIVKTYFYDRRLHILTGNALVLGQTRCRKTTFVYKIEKKLHVRKN